MKPGHHLMHDPADEKFGTDLAVWKVAQGITMVAYSVVAWDGRLAEIEASFDPSPERFAHYHLNPAQTDVLLVAAAHGVFRTVARRMLKELAGST